MNNYDILYERVSELIEESPAELRPEEASREELNEIEELRRFAAELQDPQPTSYTST